jgi:hypothetical protein
MAGRLIGKGSANSSTVASPSASRRTIERRVGSDKAAKTTSNRSGAVTGIVAVPPVDTSQLRYLTEYLNIVKSGPRVDVAHRSEVPSGARRCHEAGVRGGSDGELEWSFVVIRPAVPLSPSSGQGTQQTGSPR